MSYAIRPFLYQLAVVFALIVVGWSPASAHGAQHMAVTAGYSVAVAGESGAAHHGSETGIGAPVHAGLIDVDCAKGFPSGGHSSGCCALACHIFVETHGPALFYQAWTGLLRHDVTVIGSPLLRMGRLDRPPDLPA